MTEITISGTTGVGKTLYADGLVRTAENAGLSVAVSDHELFTSHQRFEARLASVRQRHKDGGTDLSIIVVNNRERSLVVDFGGRVPHRLACVIFPGMQELAQ